MKKIILCLLLVLPLIKVIAQRGPVNPRLTELNNEKDSLVLQQKLATLYASKEESDLSLLSSYYASKRNREKADEISKLILQKHPNGLAAYNQMSEAIYNETDPFLPGNRMFSNMLWDKGIANQFYTWSEDAHRPRYWRQMVPMYL